MLGSDLKALYDSYQDMYEEGDGISCEMIEEIVEELVEECVEFGYTIDEATTAVANAAILYIDEAKVTYGSDTESPEQRRERAKAKVGEKKAAARKAAVKTAVGRAKAKATGAVAGAGIAASIAKDTARRAARTAVHKVTYGAQKKKEEVKSGVKSLIGRGLRKAAGAVGKVAQKAAGAASRLGEEVQQLDEISDRKVKGMLRKREAQDVDSGGISAAYMANRRAQQAAARRNQRTGSNVKVDPILSKEEVKLDTWDVVLEYLITNGHADTNAEALYVMSQLDEETILGIVEAQYARENPEKYEREQRSKETSGQSAERRVRDRLSTMDPAKAEKMKAQMRAVGLNV